MHISLILQWLALFTMSLHYGNTHIIDLTMISVLLTMNLHHGNTHIIDSRMISVVCAMISITAIHISFILQ